MPDLDYATMLQMALEEARQGRAKPPTRPVPAVVESPTPAIEDMQEIHSRLKARETPLPRFCWHCRKPLHARSDRCPFCGEAQ